MRLSSAHFVASLFSIASLALVSVASADIWTWKDSGGLSHYSDQPVEGAVRVKSTPTHTASSSASSSTSTSRPDTKSKLAAMNDAADATRVKSNAEAAVQADVAKKQDEQCKQAKATYDNAINSRRILKDGPDGGQQPMTDTEANDYRVKAHTDMDTICGKPQ